MQLFKHSPLDRHYYEEIEAQYGGHKMEHQVCGYLTSYELSNDYLLLDIAVNFPDKTEESTLLAYYFTAPGVNTELCDLFMEARGWHTDNTITVNALLDYNIDVFVTYNRCFDCYEVSRLGIQEEIYLTTDVDTSINLSDVCIIGKFGKRI